VLKVSGQEPDNFGNDNQSGNSQQSEANSQQTEEKDTVKLSITLRALRSDLMSFDSVPFDTTLQNIHLQHQQEKKYFIQSSFLGNIGLAVKPVNFFQQKNADDLFFNDAVDYNFIHKEDILYYRTNHPYSNISYNASAAKNIDLQSLRFLHTQNVNRKLNFGTYLNLHSSNGVYQNQKSSVNSLSLFSSYDGDYYSYNAVVSYNTLKNRENGGLTNDTLFEDDNDKGSVYPTVFENASTNIRNTYVFLSQRFNLAGVRDLISKQEDSVRRFSGIGLLHTLELNRNKRMYSDPAGPTATTVYRYYNKFNLDSAVTEDSLYFLRLENSVELLLGKQNPNEPPILVRAGIKSLYDKYKYSTNRDTFVTVNETGVNDTSYLISYDGNKSNNLAFTGGISVGVKTFFLLNANADYYFAGDKAGDLYLHGRLSNKFSKKPGSPSFAILMDISRYKPVYLYKRYSSNHFWWENDFIPVKDIRTGFEFTWPDIDFAADFNYALLSSPVYFDSIANPAQYSGEMSVLESSIYKGFKAGIFHTSFKAVLQVTSNDRVVSVPLISAYNSSYIELKLFKKVMTTQLGYDLRYNTEFYIPGYNPDLGVFFNQHQRKMGNYPFVDVFLNVKLKRMRFFLKLEHVNYDLLSRDFYTTLHYPMNSRTLMFGLSWNFYN
jgi:hypothetical protein